MPSLLQRLSTPTSPGALLQAVHPDIGIHLPGASPTGTVQQMSPEPSGMVIEIAAPSTWTGCDAGESVVIAADVDGVRHVATFEQLESPTPEPSDRPSRYILGMLVEGLSRRSGKIRILVDHGADDPVSLHLRESTAPGDRVYLQGPSPIDLRRTPDKPREGGSGAGRAANADAETFTARFAQSDVTVPTATDQSLLGLAESAGLEPTTGCRRGVCHRCTTELLSGTTTNSRDGTMGSTGDAIRICVSTATSNVELAL